ncbi:MAG: hypothetical protein AAGB11_20435 [Pseudomonadota bacterium]
MAGNGPTAAFVDGRRPPLVSRQNWGRFMGRWKLSAAAILAALWGLGVSAAHAEEFSVTGRYDGVVACDSTTAAVPSQWSRPIEVLIVQENQDLRVEYKYRDTAELGDEYTLYRGKMALSSNSALVSAYFSSCGASFPSQELVRMFPSSTADEPFGFAADSVWVSNAVPNLPGLTVQSCRWSLHRVSMDEPSVRPCPDRP